MAEFVAEGLKPATEMLQPFSPATLIPKDASIVFSMNIGQISEKANLFSEENIKFFEKQLSKGAKKAVVKQIVGILKDPSSSGIDINTPSYIYGDLGQAGSNYRFYMGMSLKLSDVKRFRALIDSEDGKQMKTTTREFAGFEIIEDSKSNSKEYFVLATNKEQALLFLGEGQAEQLKLFAQSILQQKATDSFASTVAFAKMVDKHDDFELSCNIIGLCKSEDVQKELKKMNGRSRARLDSTFLGNILKYKDLYYVCGLNSEENALKLFTQTYSSDPAYKELLKESRAICPMMKGDFLKLIPENSLLSLAMAFNGKSAWDLAMKYDSKTVLETKKKTSKSFEKLGCTLEEFMQLFNGDIAFDMSLDPMRAVMGQIDFRVLIETKDPTLAAKVLKNIAADASKQKLKHLAKNQYVVKDKMDIHFGLQGNIIYCASLPKGTDVSKVFEPVAPNMQEGKFAKIFNQKRAAFNFNLSELIEIAMPVFGRGVSAPVKHVLEELDYFAISSAKDIRNTESVLQLKNAEPYSLLLNLLKEQMDSDSSTKIVMPY